MVVRQINCFTFLKKSLNIIVTGGLKKMRKNLLSYFFIGLLAMGCSDKPDSDNPADEIIDKNNPKTQSNPIEQKGSLQNLKKSAKSKSLKAKQEPKDTAASEVEKLANHQSSAKPRRQSLIVRRTRVTKTSDSTKDIKKTKQDAHVAYSPDGKIFALATHDGTVQLWNAVSGSLKRTL